MSQVTLMILPTVVKERTTMHSNVDEKLIFPEIEAAQTMRVRPLLGSVLYNKILDDITNDTLTGEYKKIVDDFLVLALCNYVMSEMPDSINFQVWNKGVSGSRDENSNSPDMSSLYHMIAKYKKRAEHYANSCRLYILQNLNSFPEYYAAGGVDKISPDKNTYTCPIYLGGSDLPYNYDRPNHDQNYNSNDPYYIN